MNGITKERIEALREILASSGPVEQVAAMMEAAPALLAAAEGAMAGWTLYGNARKEIQRLQQAMIRVEELAWVAGRLEIKKFARETLTAPFPVGGK